MVGGKITSRQNLESLSPHLQFLIHALIIRASKERDTDVEEHLAGVPQRVAFPKGFAADAIRSASALFQNSRIPCQVVVDHMTAMTVQINPLLSNTGANENLRQQRRVEAIEYPIASVPAATTFHQGYELLIPEARRIIECSSGGFAVSHTAACSMKILQEHTHSVGHAFVLVG